MGLQTFRHISETVYVEDHNVCCFVENFARCTHNTNEGEMPLHDYGNSTFKIIIEASDH